MGIKIGTRIIGENQPCYIIAEAGVNHNGKLDLALELIEKAKEVGADCVKFQTFKAKSIITKNAPKAKYQLKVTDPLESQYQMLEKLELNESDYSKLIEYCKKNEIDFLSTPYNYSDAVFLNDLGVEAFKIASGQIVETPFLEKVAAFNKPIITSSGMASLAEVYEGVMAIRNSGNDQVVLLQCTTNYPSLVEDANIFAMTSMKQALDVTIGYSDHVPNNYACYAAVALGASVIEKHFTLDNNLPGPDHKASLNIADFKELCKGIRNVEASLGSKVKTPSQIESSNIEGMRRSIVLSKDVKKGEVLTETHFSFKRPASGLAPSDISKLIGKRALKDLNADNILSYRHVEW